jgi:hypothetical protein
MAYLRTLRTSNLDPPAARNSPLCVCVIRIVNRFINPPPGLPGHYRCGASDPCPGAHCLAAFV